MINMGLMFLWCVCCVIVCLFFFFLYIFFFQAEDGIRDLVRSRGLGDVYKRQGCAGHARAHGLGHAQFDGWYPGGASPDAECRARLSGHQERALVIRSSGPVSYTHLTLPTSDLV